MLSYVSSAYTLYLSCFICKNLCQTERGTDEYRERERVFVMNLFLKVEVCYNGTMRKPECHDP